MSATLTSTGITYYDGTSDTEIKTWPFNSAQTVVPSTNTTFSGLYPTVNSHWLKLTACIHVRYSSGPNNTYIQPLDTAGATMLVSANSSRYYKFSTLPTFQSSVISNICHSSATYDPFDSAKIEVYYVKPYMYFYTSTLTAGTSSTIRHSAGYITSASGSTYLDAFKVTGGNTSFIHFKAITEGRVS